MRCLLLLLLSASLLQGGDTPIVGPPSISYETVLRVLQLRPASPLIPYAQDIWAASQAANIDVAFALAIWLKEIGVRHHGRVHDDAQHGQPDLRGRRSVRAQRL